jgi:2-polyprenyl-6-hydroxyphenyl methylase/3-demethylubiquinone-9 3-methyltransferase
MSNSRDIYEKYWRAPSPPPQGDPTTEMRKFLLTKSLARFSPPNEKKNILGAGCGDGEFIDFFSGMGFGVSGIDVSPTAIEYAQKRNPGASLHAGALEEPLPYSSGDFDVVWCSEDLEHLFDVPKALSELNRVLKEGGLFLLTVPYHGPIKNLVIALRGFEKHYDVTGPHIRFFTRKSLAACLSSAGFEPVWWCGVGRVWPLNKSFFVASRKMSLPSSPDRG